MRDLARQLIKTFQLDMSVSRFLTAVSEYKTRLYRLDSWAEKESLQTGPAFPIEENEPQLKMRLRNTRIFSENGIFWILTIY